jgi:hypothetical protein
MQKKTPTLTLLMFLPVGLIERGFPSISTTAKEQVASNPIPFTALLATFFVTSFNKGTTSDE